MKMAGGSGFSERCKISQSNQLKLYNEDYTLKLD